MSFQGPYREVKREIESESEEEWDQVPQGYQPLQVHEEDIGIMNAASIEALVQAALAQQEQKLRAKFQNQISAVNQQLKSLRVEAQEVETYQRTGVNPIPVSCDIHYT